MCKRDGLASLAVSATNPRVAETVAVWLVYLVFWPFFLLLIFLTILLTYLWTLAIPCAGRFKLRGAWPKERRMLGGPYRGLMPERDR